MPEFETVYVACYQPSVYEGGFTPLSVHRSPESAQSALDKHRQSVIEQYGSLKETLGTYCSGDDFMSISEILEHKRWAVKTLPMED